MFSLYFQFTKSTFLYIIILNVTIFQCLSAFHNMADNMIIFHPDCHCAAGWFMIIITGNRHINQCKAGFFTGDMRILDFNELFILCCKENLTNSILHQYLCFCIDMNSFNCAYSRNGLFFL